LLGGMVIWGLVPGPRLFVEEIEFIRGLLGSFYLLKQAALLINTTIIPVFVRMLRMPCTTLARTRARCRCHRAIRRSFSPVRSRVRSRSWRWS
jgi:TctA family transporter